MKALVLAAGIGERLRPLTETTPKPMLDLNGRALIHYALSMLKRAGITEVAVNVHHLAGKLQSALGDGSQLGLHITWAPEPVLLGTGGPLNGLRDFLRDDTFVIANSDTILDLDLAKVIAFHRERGALATIGLNRPENLDYYSRFELDDDSRIRRVRLLKRRNPLEYDDYPLESSAQTLPDDHMYCGFIVVEPACLDLIPQSPPWSLFQGLVGPMVARRLPVFGWVHRGLMRTVDDLQGYERLREEFAANPPKLHFE